MPTRVRWPLVTVKGEWCEAGKPFWNQHPSLVPCLHGLICGAVFPSRKEGFCYLWAQSPRDDRAAGEKRNDEKWWNQPSLEVVDAKQES